jgi:signal transduction histidine kinase
MRPVQHDLEAEVRTTIHALLHAWVQRGEGAIDRFLAYVADDFTGFGTGPDDHIRDRDALRALTEREQANLPYPVTIEVPWLQLRLLHPHLAQAEGELKADVHMEAETFVVAIRCTLVLERRNDRWLLVHAHYSVPDAAQDEGDTLMDTLEARNRALEREVALRTAELERSLDHLKAAQARLVQQEKMASLGALTAGIAHEIKNPLNFINNFAALSRELADDLAAETDPEEIQAILADLKTNAEKIETHGRRADGIVRAMLEHARSGSGERRSVDLNALVVEYVELARHGQRARSTDVGVEIIRELGAAVGHVDVVPQDIGRVVLNLIGNAFDAVAERAAQVNGSYAPRVAVTTRRREGEVVIRVADNGPGIPEAGRAKVFEPFFTTKPAGSGTGLGLSLSHDIVTQGHGGTLTVESEEGRGATFIVTLPAPRPGPPPPV